MWPGIVKWKAGCAGYGFKGLYRNDIGFIFLTDFPTNFRLYHNETYHWSWSSRSLQLFYWDRDRQNQMCKHPTERVEFTRGPRHVVLPVGNACYMPNRSAFICPLKWRSRSTFASVFLFILIYVLNTLPYLTNGTQWPRNKLCVGYWVTHLVPGNRSSGIYSIKG